MKKIILTVFAATGLLLSSTPAFAEFFSISVGIPLSQSFSGLESSSIPYPAGKRTKWESDGTSGYFIAAKLPFGVGLGVDSYKTKIKHANDDASDGSQPDKKLATDIYNIFYVIPVPFVNLTVGLGMGKSKVECGGKCADSYIHTDKYGGDYKTGYKEGSVSQWYLSAGFLIMPLFDIHLSYRSITNKKIEQGYSGHKLDASGSVTGIGLAFNF